MKNIHCVAIVLLLCMAACQKSNESIMGGPASREDSTNIPGGDTITYEVISTDTAGWYGMWMDENSRLISNRLDSITYGSPFYLKSGCKYSFVPRHHPFQALISVANKTYSHDITVNLYKGGQLIKSVKSDVLGGVAKLMADLDTTVVRGTATEPVLTYEVLMSNANSTGFEADSWRGQWNMPNAKPNDAVDGVSNPLLSGFAIPAGWHYTFKPDRLPFDMSLFAMPYAGDSSNVTINFYVNDQLVKSAASRTQQRVTYTVQ